MTTGRRRRKSDNWRRQQNKDPYVRKARAGGARARSFFKLEQIDRKYRLIRPSTRVVDLGSAPGSWTQYVTERVSSQAQVVAVDRLAMDPVPGVHFVQGDFTDSGVSDDVLAWLGDSPVDLVLSDMAPNITGIRATDEARAEEIQEAVMEFCDRALRPGGTLLTKLFEDGTATGIRRVMGLRFDRTVTVKPDASRAESREFYLLGRGFRGGTAIGKEGD